MKRGSAARHLRGGSRFVAVTLAATILLLGSASVSSNAFAQAGAEGAAPPPPPRVDMGTVQKIRERFDQEPTVQEVQKAALRFFKVHPEKVSAYRVGAEWKALVPDLEVSFNTERDNSKRLMSDGLYRLSDPPINPKEDEDSARRMYSLGLRAHWALDRLVFNSEVLDVSSMVGIQEGLLREVTSLYFTRRRLMTMFALNPPQDPGEQITESIRLDEITANIDALTGGFLSEEIQRRFD